MRFLKLFIPIFIAVFLIISDYRFSYLNNLKQTVAILISPIYLLVNLPSQLYAWVNEQGTDKEILLNKNRQLTDKTAKLEAKIQTYDGLLLENKKLKKLLNTSYTLKKQKFILAKVSSIAQSRLKKKIIINKGSSAGLKVGQVAIGAQGVVGQVTQVTPLYSTILMITDPTQYVPVKNSRNGIRGIGKGLALKQNRLRVDFIESDLDITVGDIFLTSAIGSKFVQDYPVGEVINVKKQANSQFLQIELKPVQKPLQLEFVLIILNKS